MPDFASINEALNNPAQRHAMLVHAPIALSLFCVLLTLLSAILSSNTTLRAIAIGASALLVLTSLATVNSGEAADQAIAGPLVPAAAEVLHDHEEMAEALSWFGAAILLLLACSLAKWPPARRGGAWLAFLASMGCAAWAAQTAHLGGTLVYAHGVGVPAASARSASPTSEAAAVGVPSATSSFPADPKIAHFKQVVLPILTTQCTKCHNPQRARRSGGLDQTSREAMLAGGRTGPALMPGDPDRSRLIQRVRSTDPEERMPPGDHALTEEEIIALERWIADGAVWEADTDDTSSQ